jgi:hypothetical protein
MASVFRASLSSFGAGLESGFDAGFGSGFSAFDFTMDVLLFLLLLPGAGPGEAWKMVGQALQKAHWSLLNSRNGQRYASENPLTDSGRARFLNESNCIPTLPSSKASVRYGVLRLKFPDRYLPWRLNMMGEINIAAATTKGEARGKYLPAQMRNLYKNAQQRFIEGGDVGSMEAIQSRGEPSVDTDMTVIQAGYSS